MMKIAKIVLINLIILLLLIVIIDPFISSLPSTKTDRYIRLREPNPNLDLTFHTSSQFVNSGPYRLRTNKEGFYTGEIEPKDLNNPDIIFFGGSTTECSVMEENQRFPYLVGRKLLDSLTKQNIKTLNAGLSGNNTMHSFMSLMAKGLPLKPKAVFLMHNINDLSQLLKTGSYWESPEGRSIVVDQSANSYSEKITKVLKASKDLLIPNIYNLTKSKMILAGNQVVDEWEDYRNVNHQPVDSIVLVYEKAIKTFVRVAKTHDVKVVLMTQFNRFDKEDQYIKENFSFAYSGLAYEDFCESYQKFNDKAREIAEEESVDLIDLAKHVDPADEYLYDYVHLNGQGSELVADIIANWVAQNFEGYQLKN